VIVSVETDNTRILVVGNAEFVTASFALSNQSNAVMFINGLDWLAQDDVLSAIRAKNLTKAPLLFKSETQKKAIKYFNVIGVPLLVILAGVAVLYRRRRIMRRVWEE